MIPVCKTYFESLLREVGIQTVYTDPEDESRHKGIEYGFLWVSDPEEYVKEKKNVGYTDDLTAMLRTHHTQQYKVTATFTVRIAAKTEQAANNYKTAFLQKLISYIPDDKDYAIELIPRNGNLVTDKSVIRNGAAYEISIDCLGGIYTTRTVPLLPTAEPEGEFVKEV